MIENFWRDFAYYCDFSWWAVALCSLEKGFIQDFCERHYLIHFLWISRKLDKTIFENNIVRAWFSIPWEIVRWFSEAYRHVSLHQQGSIQFTKYFESRPQISVSLPIVMRTSSNKNLSTWPVKVLECRSSNANFICFSLEGHVDRVKLNCLLQEMKISMNEGNMLIFSSWIESFWPLFA